MNDEPTGDVHDRLDLDQAILPKRLPALHQIHDLIGEMEQEEQGLLKLRIDEANASARWVDQLFIVGNLLALALVVLSGWAI